MNREIAKEALTFLQEVKAQAEAEEEFSSGQWVLFTYDTETSVVEVFGPYDDPIRAMRDGEEHDEAINEGEPVPTPILFAVLPLKESIT